MGTCDAVDLLEVGVKVARVDSSMSVVTSAAGVLRVGRSASAINSSISFLSSGRYCSTIGCFGLAASIVIYFATVTEFVVLGGPVRGRMPFC